ncbi:uncharacterized protein J3R85_020542 [Psidium guajava]|nr:uncharacterized protein J3R85_020542 [Psidium guajava]
MKIIFPAISTSLARVIGKFSFLSSIHVLSLYPRAFAHRQKHVPEEPFLDVAKSITKATFHLQLPRSPAMATHLPTLIKAELGTRRLASWPMARLRKE